MIEWLALEASLRRLLVPGGRLRRSPPSSMPQVGPMLRTNIAPTAHVTAYVWYRAGFAYADLFRTRLGASLFWGFYPLGHGLLPRLSSGAPTLSAYLELRHRWIDDLLAELTPDVVVELGAGLSRRGVAFASSGTPYVEVDLPSMVELKRRLIDARAPDGLRRRLGGLHLDAHDVLLPGFERRLGRLLRGARRPAVVAEGLYGYLSIPACAGLTAAVARALDGRGAFVCEMRSREDDQALGPAVAAVKGAVFVATAGGGRRRELPSTEAVREFFLAAGFARAEPLARERVPALLSIEAPTRVWHASSSI